MERVNYQNVAEGREGLRDRGISDDVIDDVEGVVDEAAGALVDRLDVRDEVDVDTVRESLTVGTMEVMVEFVDAGIHDEADIRELAGEIHENDMELALIVGRMARRDWDMYHLAAALHRGRRGNDA